jgi:hypothetical protein
MKSFILISSLSLLFASCTTAYKTSQTPDDVYFSPERPQVEYVRAEKNEDRQYRAEERTSNDDYYSYDDRYLRMKVRNRYRWNYLDDPYYSYNPYAYRYYNNYSFYNSPWNNYSYWNHYYNPYAPQIIVVNPKSPTYNRPRTTNLNVFNNNPPRQLTVNPNATGNPKTRTNTGTNNNRPRRDFGDDLRNVFGNDNNRSSNRTYENNTSTNRSTNNNSSSSGNSGSSSSGSSSGGNAPVRRF